MRLGETRGFTLIEVMIVVGIIAVIAAIGIPSLVQARRTSNEKATLASLRNFGSAALQYSMDNPEQLFWPSHALPDDFKSYYAFKRIRSGYRYYYIANWDRTKYVCIAIPVSTMAGSKAFYVDEAIALWEFDQGDDPPDYTGSHINWAAPPGVELEGGERRLQLGEYLLERK